jgi:hypothetical protein
VVEESELRQARHSLVIAGQMITDDFKRRF